MHVHTSGNLTLHSPMGQRKYLTADERRRFLYAAEQHPRHDVRTFCLVLAYTGCRISEVLALAPSSFDSAEGLVAVRCLKKRSKVPIVRELPLPARIIRMLASADPEHDGTTRLWPWCRSYAWQLVRNVMNTAKISPGPHATPKGLRHGFGLHAVRCGVPLNLVQRWLGHASMNTTAIYLQALGREEREFAARMWDEPCPFRV